MSAVFHYWISSMDKYYTWNFATHWNICLSHHECEGNTLPNCLYFLFKVTSDALRQSEDYCLAVSHPTPPPHTHLHRSPVNSSQNWEEVKGQSRRVSEYRFYIRPRAQTSTYFQGWKGQSGKTNDIINRVLLPTWRWIVKVGSSWIFFSTSGVVSHLKFTIIFIVVF